MTSERETLHCLQQANHFERACLAKNRKNTRRYKGKRVSLATEDDAQILKAYTGQNLKDLHGS